MSILFTLLAGCGGTPTSTPPIAPAANGQSEAVARVGDVTIRASVVQTSTLNETVARDYGITRDDNTILLLVAVRQGPEASETALPARIAATVTDLSGRTQSIVMRELRTSDPGAASGQMLLDYIGTVETSLPDTLRFDLSIVRAGGARSTMQFNREFFP